MAIPKPYNNEALNTNPTDFSKVFDSMKSMSLLSKDAYAILMEMRKNARQGHENVHQNSFLLKLEKEHNVLEDLITKLPEESDREQLQKSFDELKKAFNKNTSWIQELGTQMQSSLMERVEKNGGVTNLSMLGESLRSIKDSAVNSLPPLWKGLYDIGIKKYQEAKSRKEMVYENVQQNLEEYVSNSEINNNSEKESVTLNQSFDEVSQSIKDLEETQRQGYDEIITRLDDIIRQEITNKETGEIDEVKYQALMEDVRGGMIEELQSFTQTATNEEKSILENVVGNQELFTQLVENEYSKLNESSFDTQSFAQKEASETFQRETVREQRDINENLEKIYKFISGEKNSSAKKENEQGGLFSDILSSWKDGIFKSLGGKIIGKFFNSKVGKKVASTKIGQKVLSSEGGKKMLSSMGVGNTVENVTKNAAENVTKNVAKSSVDTVAKNTTENIVKDVAKSSTDNIAKTVAKEGAEKVATKTGGKELLKIVAKNGAKSVIKKIPGVSLIAGGLFALQRALAGDFTGAAMELASGAAGTIPLLGTGASLAMDAALTARDIKNASEGEATVSSDSGGEKFTPIDAPKEISTTNTKEDVYNKHLSQTDDGKVIERHVSEVKDIKADLKKHFDERSSNSRISEKRLQNEDITSTYNQALFKEVYGDNYSLDIRPYGIYDKNNDMAFTPVVRDKNGIITKILKNTSDHIKEGEEGYISPTKNSMEVLNEASSKRTEAYNNELFTRSTEEQTDRKRLDELNEQILYSGGIGMQAEETERNALREKIATNYKPVLTKEQESQYDISNQMSNLIDKTVKKETFTDVSSNNTKSFSETKNTTSTEALRNTEEVKNTSFKDMAYTASTTRGGGSSQVSQQPQQPPTIINNNYNTTTSPQPISTSKPTPPPQFLVNPVPASSWQGTGWGGIR